MTPPVERDSDGPPDGTPARAGMAPAFGGPAMDNGLGPLAGGILRIVERWGWQLAAAGGIGLFLVLAVALAGIVQLALRGSGVSAGLAPLLVACTSTLVAAPAIVIALRMVDHLCGLRDRLEDEVLRRSTAEARLIRMVGEDDLTGLGNRRQFVWQARAALAMARRYRQNVALLLIDIDRFKDVNDGLGHEVGDQALVRVAQILRLMLRETDTAARQGGDEFAVLLPHTGLDAAMLVAERIREAVATDPGPPGLTVSIGCAAADHGRMQLSHLLRLADQALYAAKAAGRNRVVASGRGHAGVAERLDVTAS